MKIKNETIKELSEEMQEYICDNVCHYPYVCKSEEHLKNACSQCLIEYYVDAINKRSNEETSDKPIIKYCENCVWCHEHTFTYNLKCVVKYKKIYDGRKESRFCRYYKQKAGGKNEKET
jgi:hypothetical protein